MHWIDPDCLPETKGKVERFVVNPKGPIDGLVLDCGEDRAKLVHVPPHLGAEIEAALQPGDAVRVRGLRPRGADMIAAVALTTGNGHAIVDNGPDDKPRKDSDEKPPRRLAKLEAAGKVRLSLYAPKGELRGALLQDGSVVRIGPKEALRFAALLKPGASVAVRGEGLETKYGRVVDSSEIGADLAGLAPAKGPKPNT